MDQAVYPKLESIQMIQGALGKTLGPGELGVLLAWTGVGKTACLTHLALEQMLKGAIWNADFAEFVKAHPDLDNELNKRAWRDTLPRLAKRPAALDRGRYERFAAFMRDAGLIKEIPPLESYAVEPGNR